MPRSRFSLTISIAESTSFAFSSTPVSYTHLDVYKRQQRTSGRFITEDKELIHQMKKELAAAEVSAFVAHMKQLGITPEEIRQLLAETIEEEENHE